MKRWVLLFLSLGFGVPTSRLHAQYLFESHEPTTFTRRQICVGPLRVIYRENLDSLAHVVARWGAFYRGVTAISPQRKRPFPLVLWGQTVIPNGMVVWTPSRMELYPLTGGEERTPVPWLQHLVSHEIRHYAQMEALDRKLLRFLYYFLGQQNVGVGALIPSNWYFEGDAIHSESKYAPFGRVHSAVHLQAYRADLLDGRELSYDQYRFRSFKYNVPDHYSFGTMMIESTVSRYGEDLWPSVMEYNAKYPFLIISETFALKKFTKRNPVKLFASALREADSIFIRRVEPGERPIPIAKGEYQSERQPWQPNGYPFRFQWVSDLSHPLAFQRIDTITKRTKTLFHPGAKLGAARYGDSVALWIEAVRHPRWSGVVWGDVYAFTIASGRRRRVTYRQRLLSPVPLEGDSTFVAVAIGDRGENRVVRFRLSDGRALDTARLVPPLELRELSRGNGRDEILLRGVNGLGAFVLAYDWTRAVADTVLSPLTLDIGSLTPAADSGFYFTASRNGRQQPFYARRTQGKRVEGIFRVALRNHGVDDLHAAADGALEYSEYTINGYRARRASNLDLRPCESLPTPQPLFPLEQELPNGGMSPAGSDSAFRSKRYSPLLHAVRVHSWTPFYFNPFGGVQGIEDVKLGASISSQNTTGSLAFSFGYFYKERHGAAFTAVWQGWYPAVSVSATYGMDPRRVISSDTVLLLPHSMALAVGVSVPLVFRRGAMVMSLLPRLSLGFRNDEMRLDGMRDLVVGTADVGYSLFFSALSVQAHRDVYPRWGLKLKFGGKSMVRPARLVGPRVEAEGTLYLPGVGTNHSLRLSSFVAKSYGATYTAAFTMPVRGLMYNFPAKELQATVGWSVAADYTLPLGYPDWSLPGWLYVQRVYSNLAFAYTSYRPVKGEMQRKRAFYIDLISDLHLFRFSLGLSVGMSLGYSPWGDRLGPRPWGPWSLNGIFNLKL